MSSNRRFLENVWKLLGIFSSNGSTIKSSLKFLRKLKVLTENFQMFSSRKTSFPVLIQSIFPSLIFFIEFTPTFRKSRKLSIESKITSLIVVKLELGSRIRRQCPQQNFNVTSAGSASTSKIKLTEQCCVAGRFVMSSMFLLKS